MPRGNRFASGYSPVLKNGPASRNDGDGWIQAVTEPILGFEERSAAQGLEGSRFLLHEVEHARLKHCVCQ